MDFRKDIKIEDFEVKPIKTETKIVDMNSLPNKIEVNTKISSEETPNYLKNEIQSKVKAEQNQQNRKDFGKRRLEDMVGVSGHQQNVYISDEEPQQKKLTPEIVRTDTRKDGRVYKCDTCHKQFDQLDQLEADQLIHFKKRPVPCDWIGCAKRYFNVEALDRHKRRDHMKERTFECDFKDCDQSFFNFANLRRHKRSHSGDMPYVCHRKKCRQRFAQKSELDSHETIHLNRNNQ